MLEIKTLLGRIQVLALRLSLLLPVEEATLTRLRGVWGAALYDLDIETYKRVFDGEMDGVKGLPLYVLRPASRGAGDGFEVDFILFGAAVHVLPTLLGAWQLAGARGLGKKRLPFCIQNIRLLTPSGDMQPFTYRPWSLLEAAEAVSTTERGVAMGIVFPTPLRILRNKKMLVTPTLETVVIALVRRVAGLSSLKEQRRLTSELAAMAREWPCQWEGESCSVMHYSARQKSEVVREAVCGVLHLPAGAGPLTPLLKAGTWSQVGKGTTVGFGQMVLCRHQG